MVPPLIRKLRLSAIVIAILSVGYAGLPARLGLCAPAAEGGAAGSSAGPAKYVRVAISQGVETLDLRAKGFYEITDPVKKEVLLRGKDLKTTVVAFKRGIMIGAKAINTDRALIGVKGRGVLVLNGRSFRGNIEVIKKDDMRFLVVNHIGLEDYVKGISVRETSHYWPVEALKAEVIAFRTFALYKIQEGLGKDYDLTSDVYSQVYGGAAAERYRINKAVDETRGMALFYGGKIFSAFYHATCAGHTEDASLLWNINLPPLKGVACDFCKDSPHFKWHSVLSQNEIKEKLKKAGYSLNSIKEIKILGKDSSSRITGLNIITQEKEINISGKDFREAVGPNIIRSTNFNVSLANGDMVFEGLGWGHGVGLCQWGAYFMSKQGYKYEEILKYYYPGSDVETIGF